MSKEIETSDVSRQIKAGIVLVLLCMILIFALQNSASVTVVFLLWEMALPRVLIFFVFFVVGFLTGLAISNWRKLKHRRHSGHSTVE
jgi:uncharacterized integral membrane protein